MSDSEARERRRAKILAAKDDRMARIVGSVSGSSSEASDSVKTNKTSDKPAMKPKNASDIKKSIPIDASGTKSNVTSVDDAEKQLKKNLSANTIEKKNVSLNINESHIHQKASNLLHVSILIFAALLVTLLSKKCSVLSQYFQLNALQKGICPVVEGAPWSILISVFLVIEFGEFLLGHVQLTKGANTMIIKDLCLYLFVILIFSQL